jgi:hypothetical protein
MENNSFIGLLKQGFLLFFLFIIWNFEDIIGIIKSINDIVHGKSKQNKDYTKRDILILDRTGQITVTLWYQTVFKKQKSIIIIKKTKNIFQAENFQTSVIRTIIMLKGACVNDFNGGIDKYYYTIKETKNNKFLFILRSNFICT